jgi:hypothetical protein
VITWVFIWALFQHQTGRKHGKGGGNIPRKKKSSTSKMVIVQCVVGWIASNGRETTAVKFAQNVEESAMLGEFLTL